MRGLWLDWMKAPYVDARRQDEFDRWCESENVDPEQDGAWEMFEKFLGDQYEDEERE